MAQNVLAPYGEDEATIKRKIAYQMMVRGMDASPVQHWTQGAARAMQGALGGYEMYRNDKEQSDKEMAGANFLSTLFPQGQGTSPSPAMPQQQRSPLVGALSGNAAPGKVYSPDEPSPLDPPSGQDRDLAIRTVLAEAGNQGPLWKWRTRVMTRRTAPRISTRRKLRRPLAATPHLGTTAQARTLAITAFLAARPHNRGRRSHLSIRRAA